VLARNALDEGHTHAPGNLEKLLHPLSVNILVFGVVGQVAGKPDEVGTLSQIVDPLDGGFECLGAKRAGRTAEFHLGVAQLNEGEGRDPFATFLSPEVEHLRGFAAYGGRCRHRRVEGPDTQGWAGQLEK